MFFEFWRLFFRLFYVFFEFLFFVVGLVEVNLGWVKEMFFFGNLGLV